MVFCRDEVTRLRAIVAIHDTTLGPGLGGIRMREYASDAEALIKKTIKELSEELDPTMFRQVHRSTMVNVHAIDRVIRDDYGNLKLRLKHRSEVLSVSEAYHHLFQQM